MQPRPGPPRKVAAVIAALMAIYLVHNALRLGGQEPGVVGTVLHSILMLAVPALLLHAAWCRRGESGLVWLLFGLGTIGLTIGEILFVTVYADAAPFPSWCDAAWLSWYPLAYVASVLLLRVRLAEITVATWLDGAICGLAAVAVAAATFYGPLLQTSTDGIVLTAVAVAYPIGDLALLTAVITVLVMTGWRPGRVWSWVGAGLLLSFVADTIYALKSASGTFVAGGLVDTAFPLAGLLMVRAAWLPTPQRIAVALGERRSLAAPAICTVVAFALASFGAAGRFEPIVMMLALATVALALIRAAITVLDHSRLLVVVHDEAITDSLTGLHNRRRLRTDLAHALSGDRVLAALALYDLNGFKTYNDAFGHGAGDALLARGGRALRAAAAAYGNAYRLGGDEFCILIDAARCDAEDAARRCADALAQIGEGFHVTASYGLVRIPEEATTIDQALALADQRMYADKGASRRDGGLESRELLVAVLREREPELYAHGCHVTERAAAVARHLGVAVTGLEQIATAAALHDIGKIAIPDSILNKSGALDDDEWAFMRGHTITGERIMARSASLQAAGRLVRASHERWDGQGYPDGLAGDAIPLGARIVAVCDAYDAMITDRAYRPARTPAQARAELHAFAGTQFDPAVVAAFFAVADDTPARAPALPSAA